MSLLLFLVGVFHPRLVNGHPWTNATCTSDYAWMANSKNVSPCQVVAQLDAQCNYGSWFIKALTLGNKYDIPLNQNATVTLCTCSWASYNLISACTACQGFPDTIPNWGFYTSDCSGKTTENEYWPPTIQIPTDVKVPYWASMNPTNWCDQNFNLTEAKKLSQEGHPDFPTTTSTSSPIGAIVGGVIGVLVVVACFFFLFMWIIRRHHKAMHTTAHFNVQSTSNSSSQFFSIFIGRNSRAPIPPQDPGLPEDIIPFILPPTNDTPEKKAEHQPNTRNFVQMAITPSRMARLRSLRQEVDHFRNLLSPRRNPPTYSECYA